MRSVAACYNALRLTRGTGRFDPSQVTINGVTQSLSYLLLGADGADPWPERIGGDALAETGTGTSPDYAVDSGAPVGVHEWLKLAVDYKGDIHSRDVSTAFAPGARDFFLEAYLEWGNSTQVVLGSFATDIWELQTTTATFQFVIREGANLKSCVGPTGLSAGTMYMVHVTGDVDGSIQLSIDGTAGAATDISTIGADIDVTAFTAGARQNASVPYTGKLAYAGIWCAAGWLDSYDQSALIAQRISDWGL